MHEIMRLECICDNV